MMTLYTRANLCFGIKQSKYNILTFHRTIIQAILVYEAMKHDKTLPWNNLFATHGSYCLHKASRVKLAKAYWEIKFMIYGYHYFFKHVMLRARFAAAGGHFVWNIITIKYFLQPSFIKANIVYETSSILPDSYWH